MNIGAADVLRVLRNAGRAHLGVGTASGHDRAREAAQAAITSPLLETSITGAQALVCNIAGPADLGLLEIYEVADLITQHIGADADLVFGALIDASLGTRCRVTVIAAGIHAPTQQPQPDHRATSHLRSRPQPPAPPRDDEAHPADPDVPDFYAGLDRDGTPGSHGPVPDAWSPLPPGARGGLHRRASEAVLLEARRRVVGLPAHFKAVSDGATGVGCPSRQIRSRPASLAMNSAASARRTRSSRASASLACASRASSGARQCAQRSRRPWAGYRWLGSGDLEVDSGRSGQVDADV